MLLNFHPFFSKVTQNSFSFALTTRNEISDHFWKNSFWLEIGRFFAANFGLWYFLEILTEKCPFWVKSADFQLQKSLKYILAGREAW